MTPSVRIHIACNLIVSAALSEALAQKLPLAECVPFAYTAWLLEYSNNWPPTLDDTTYAQSVQKQLHQLFPTLN